MFRERRGHEDPNVFVYDPRAPVMSLGGRSCCNDQIAPIGPADQRPVEVLNGQTIFHDSGRPSRITLPLIPRT